MTTNYRPTHSGITLLQQLREHTRSEHRALEAQPMLRALLAPELSKDQYGRLLQALAAFFQPLEEDLQPHVQTLLARFPSGYRYQPRGPLLRADLADIGAALPLSAMPELALDTAMVPGVLYVIEGATQGGRLIAGRLQQSLQLSAGFGARYFNMHARSDSWSLFRHWITGMESWLDWEAVLRGARATFTGLHSHLDHWQVSMRDR